MKIEAPQAPHYFAIRKKLAGQLVLVLLSWDLITGRSLAFIHRCMKLAALLLVCTLLPGCLHSGFTARTEKDLSLALLEAFQQENDIPSSRNIRELKDHSWSLELTLRSVHFENNKQRILPLLRLLKQQLEKSDFVVQVERMTEEAGCSKALLSSALECASDVGFDFYEMANGELNPRYRYSQTVLDERAIFPRRLLYRPR